MEAQNHRNLNLRQGSRLQIILNWPKHLFMVEQYILMSEMKSENSYPPPPFVTFLVSLTLSQSLTHSLCHAAVAARPPSRPYFSILCRATYSYPLF